jgi:hypothetical protein
MNHSKCMEVSVTAPVRTVEGNADPPDEIMDDAPDRRPRRTGAAQDAWDPSPMQSGLRRGCPHNPDLRGTIDGPN